MPQRPSRKLHRKTPSHEEFHLLARNRFRHSVGVLGVIEDFHRHLVLCEGPRFVGTDDSGAASVSTAGSFLIMAFRLAIRLIPIAMVMVTTIGSPSGTAATEAATAILEDFRKRIPRRIRGWIWPVH